MNDQVFGPRIGLAALIAADQSRGNTGGSREIDERACKVAAETPACVEPERIDAIMVRKRRWIECVDVRLRSNVSHHLDEEIFRIASACGEVVRKRNDARIV